MSKKKTFYVYIYRDPCRGKRRQPFYVGKGHGARAEWHLRQEEHANPILRGTLKKIRAAGLKPIIEKRPQPSEDAAFAMERKLIRRIGRRDMHKGPLANMTDGGEGASGLLNSAFKRLNHDPKFQRRRKAAFDEIWTNETSRARQIAIRRETMQKILANPRTRRQHVELGRRNMTRLNADPTHREKCIVGLRDRIARDPVYREQKSQAGRASMHNHWANASYRRHMSKVQSANMSRLHADPQFQKEHRARMVARNADTAFQERRCTGLRRTMNTAAYRKKNLAHLCKVNSDPAFQRKRIAGIRRYWAARRKYHDLD
jgi:hypothetical protein